MTDHKKKEARGLVGALMRENHDLLVRVRDQEREILQLKEEISDVQGRLDHGLHRIEEVLQERDSAILELSQMRGLVAEARTFLKDVIPDGPSMGPPDPPRPDRPIEVA